MHWLAFILTATSLGSAAAKARDPVWSAVRRAKPSAALRPASKLPPHVVDTLSAIPNAPSAVVQLAVLSRDRRQATLLLLGSTPRVAPSVGGMLPDAPAAHPGGHAALVRVTPRGRPVVIDALEVAPPRYTEWRLAARLELDGDRQRDAVFGWTKSLNRVRRFGALIARADTLSLIELGNDARPRAAIDVTVACFTRVAGAGTRALLVGRRAVGRSQRAGALDSVEALLPGPDGRYVATPVFAAAFSEYAPERSARRAWIKAFRPRTSRLSAQRALGACPGEGIVLPNRALRPQANADDFAVLGPFATGSTAVRGRLDKLKRRIPGAVVVLGVGG